MTSTETTEKLTTTPTFENFNLSPLILKAIGELGYVTPSPVQEQSIPILLNGTDLLGLAKTGTGKTAAFALPLINNIDANKKKPQMLVLCPTRELALQICDAIKQFTKYTKNIKTCPVYGGSDYRTQINQLERGPQIIVGTPGRTIDHIKRKNLDISQIKAVVLDEADEMLKMGFIDDIEWILSQTPEERQTALFSATMPKSIQNITHKYFKNPTTVAIKDKTRTADTISQKFLLLKSHNKMTALLQVLEFEETDGVIVFAKTKSSAQDIAAELQKHNVKAEALHGDIPQKLREKTVERLKSSDIDVVVATDVAARGIDVERVTHVINYDTPFDCESYVHRIGRTGRAGRTGDAILFITAKEKRFLRDIQRHINKEIAEYAFPTIEQINNTKKEKLFAEIDRIIDKNLDDHTSLINEYIASREITTEKLAAAFSLIANGSEQFFTKKLPQIQLDNRPSKSSAGGNIQFKTYRIDLGKDDINKKDIVGALLNESNLSSSELGKIFINDDYTNVELPENIDSNVLSRIQRITIKGNPINLQPTNERIERRSYGGGGRSGENRGGERRNNDSRRRNDRGGNGHFKSSEGNGERRTKKFNDFKSSNPHAKKRKPRTESNVTPA